MLRLSVVPPDGWKQILIDPAHRDATVSEAIGWMRGSATVWEKAYPQLRSGMETMFANAWDAGARIAIAPVPQPEDIFRLNAVFTVGAIPFAEPFGSDADNIERVFEQALGERADLLEGESIEVAHAQVDALGDAAQVAEIRRMRSPQGLFMHGMVASLHTYVPFHGRFIVATGASPQVEVAQQLFALFAAIARSVDAVEE